MTLQLPELYAYRLGSAAETLSAQNTPDAQAKFLDELTEKINSYRPDILDAFMLGRAAARLILLAQMADSVSDYDRSTWQNLWDVTEEAVLYGASRLNILRDAVRDLINKVRQDPNRWRDAELLVKGGGKESKARALAGSHRDMPAEYASPKGRGLAWPYSFATRE